MLNWWNSLIGLEQVMASIAIPATIILIVQIVLIVFSSFGTDGDVDSGDIDDVDMSDTGLDGIQIFTIKGFVTFFSIFGWSGLLFSRMGVMPTLSVIIAFICGAFAMILMAFAFKAILKLQDSGNVDVKSALGISGTVYIKIPKKRTGMGKITAIVSGRYSEFDAVCDDEESIPTGSAVTVIAITSGNVLVVAKNTL